jgi:hypothetical protein
MIFLWLGRACHIAESQHSVELFVGIAIVAMAAMA